MKADPTKKGCEDFSDNEGISHIITGKMVNQRGCATLSAGRSENIMYYSLMKDGLTPKYVGKWTTLIRGSPPWP